MNLLMNKERLLADELAKHVIEHRVNSPTAYFMNAADWHYGLNNRDLAKEIVEFILSVPNFYLTLGGDCANYSTKLSKGNPLEEWAVGDKQLYALAEDFKPLVQAGRLLGIIEGNHTAGRLKDTIFTTPEGILAYLLGKPELYKGEMALIYFNVNKNTYIHFLQHKSGKALDKFAWISADCVWREHVHEYKAVPKLVIEHNKYTNPKKPIVKTTWEVFSGSLQVYPSYAKSGGYRPILPGTMISEMSGKPMDWKMRIWRDEDLFHMIQNGYHS